MSGVGVGIPVPKGWRAVETGHASGDGVLWDFAVDGATALIDTPTFEVGYIYRVIQEDIRAEVASSYRYVSLHDGSAWQRGSGFGYYASDRYFSAVIDLFDPANPATRNKFMGLTFANAPLAGGTGRETYYNNPSVCFASATAALRARFTYNPDELDHTGGRFKMYRMRM